MPPILSASRPMVGATGSVDGRAGQVPKPFIADRARALFGDGTWKDLPGGGDLLAANLLAEFDTNAERKSARGNIDATALDEIVSGIIASAGWVPFTAGANERVTVQPIGSNVGTGDFTLAVEVEIPLANPPGNQGLIGMGPTSTHAGGNSSLRAYLTSAGALVVRVVSAGGSATDLSIASVVSDYAGQKHKLAITRSGSVVTVFWGRRQIGAQTASAWAEPLNTAYLHLGVGGSANEVFAGKISGAWRFNYAKSPTGDFSIDRFSGVGLELGDRFARSRGKIISLPRNGDFTDAATDWTAQATGSAVLDTSNDELDVTVAATDDGAKLPAANLAQLTSGSLHRVEVELRNLAGVSAVTLKWGAQTIGVLTANKRYWFEFAPTTGVNDLTATGNAAGSFSLAGLRLTDLQGALANGGFEAGSSDGNVFAGWLKGGSVTLTDETSDTYEGGHAARLTGAGLLAASSNNWLSRPNVFAAGRRYSVQARAKRVSGSGSIQVGCGYTQVASVAGTGSWQELGPVVLTALDPVGAVQVVTSLSFAAVNGEVWLLDGVSVRELGCDLALAPWGLESESKLWQDASSNGFDGLLAGALLPLTSNTRRAEVSARKAAQSPGGLLFDGVTAGSKVVAPAPAVEDVSLWLRFRVPASLPAANYGLIGVGSSVTQLAVGGSFSVYINSAGALRARLTGAAYSDFRLASAENFWASWAGQVVDVCVSRRTLTGDLTLWVNGRRAPVVETVGGSAPAWTSAITSGSFHLGLHGATDYFSGELLRAALFNCALSPAQAASLAARAEVPMEMRWGSQTLLYASGFGAGVDGWAANDASETLAGNIDADADGAGVPPSADWLRLTAASTANVSIYRPGGPALTPGRQYVITADVYVPAGSSWTHLSVCATGGPLVSAALVAAGQQAVAPLAAGQVNAVRLAFVCGGVTSPRPIFVSTAASGGAANVTSGDAIYLKNISVTAEGALCSLRCEAGLGYQEADESSNKLHAALAPAGVEHRMARRDGKLRVRVSASGNTQLLGGSCLPANARLRSITALGAGSVTVSIGSTSGATDLVNGASVTTTRGDLTLAGRFPTAQNLWVNLSGAVAVDFEIDFSVVD